MEVENTYWKKNLYVCLFGSFTTIVAMTSLLPFLPIYVASLGVKGHSQVVQWSGIAYSITFVSAAISAPIWGKLADRYGRKPMLTRAALGMTIITAFMGMAHNLFQLLLLRFLAGLAGGYGSGATILIATQAPKNKSGWALGLLSSGEMAGNLIGPLIGGILPQWVGIRNTFWISSAIIFITFIITVFYIKEEKNRKVDVKGETKLNWKEMPAKRQVFAMLLTAMLLMVAIMSIEPILTIFISQIESNTQQLTFLSGIVLSASSLGSILSASQLGKIADKVGHSKIVVYGLILSSILLIPQAFVNAGWQLIILRFLMGLSLGGLLPCINSFIRHHVAEKNVSQVLGLCLSFQFSGQVLGPLLGGFVGGHLNFRSVFFSTSLIMLIGAFNIILSQKNKSI